MNLRRRLGMGGGGLPIVMGWLALASGWLATAPARAELLNFAAAPGSQLTLVASTLEGAITDSAVFGLTGTLSQNMTFATQGGFGQVATNTQWQDGAMPLTGADNQLFLNAGFLGSVTIDVAGLGLDAAGPLVGFTPPPTAVGTTRFALAGSSLILNAGSLTYTGTGPFSLIGTQTLNFATTPLPLVFGSGEMTVTVTPQGSNQLITAVIPLAASAAIENELSAIGLALAGSLTFTATRSVAQQLVGDANGDCSVGAADYAIWAAQFGQTGGGLSADFDSNGSVGAGDYALWAANFGKTCSPPAAGAAAVPEPATLWLALAGLAAWGLGRRFRA